MAGDDRLGADQLGRIHAVVPIHRVVAADAHQRDVDRVATAFVVRGDTLWRMSRTRFGRGRAYTRIYAANAAQIRDPKLIYPGQVFVVPDR